jgi:uncharacterized peroxidase-related enzyme
MAFIATVPVGEAAGDVRALYERYETKLGYVPNYAKVLSQRPQVAAAWSALQAAIRGGMEERRWELVTMAAARAMRNSYCALAHGEILRRRFYSPEQLAAIADDFRRSELSSADKAVLGFAEMIVHDATAVTEADIQNLRVQGFSDAEIFDIAAAAAARCFFSKLLDGLGAEPDSAYLELEEGLRRRLAVGRRVSKEALEHV